MKKHRLDARMIAIMGLLIALMVTLSRLVAIETPFIKISVTSTSDHGHSFWSFLVRDRRSFS